MLHANFDNTVVFHSHIEKKISKYNYFKHVYSLVIIENVTWISDLCNSIKYITKMIFVATIVICFSQSRIQINSLLFGSKDISSEQNILLFRAAQNFKLLNSNRFRGYTNTLYQ